MATQCGSRNQTGTSVWYAIGIPTSGTVTANLASAPDNAVIVVSRYSSVNHLAPIGASVVTGNTTGINGAAACGGGTDTGAYSLSLATSVAEAKVFSAVAMRNRTHTPGAEFWERAEVYQGIGGGIAGAAVQDKYVPTAVAVTVDGSFNGAVDWAVVALSIEPGLGGNSLITNTVGLGIIAVDPPGNVFFPGTVVTLTATASDPEWELTGWGGDLSGLTNPITMTIDADKTVTATFALKQYDLSAVTVGNGNVTLDPPGGTYDSGTVITLTAGADAHWTFAGWSGDLSGLTSPITLTMNANKSVTATFAINQYALTTATVGDGALGVQPPGSPYAAGTVVTLTAVAGPDWAFTGWSGDLAGLTTPITLTMDAAKTVTATFALNRFDLLTISDGNGSIDLDPAGGIYDLGTVVTATAVPDPHWEFTNWSGDLSGTTNPLTLTVDVEKTITATFELKQYAFVTTTIGNGNLVVDPAGGIHDALTVLTLTATADPGWFFLGWSGDLIGSTSPATVTLDANTDISATFVQMGVGGEPSFVTTSPGISSNSQSVATAGSLTAVAGDLYLAAISAKANIGVDSISGLGLEWKQLREQCSGQGHTGLEVWWALGAAGDDGVVTATFSSTVTNTVIIVSRYSGVDVANPFGDIVLGNTKGEEDVSCSGGTNSASYAFDLTTERIGAVIYGAAALDVAAHSAGSGFTERIEVSGGGGSDRVGCRGAGSSRSHPYDCKCGRLAGY